jgi:hypothetical protein
MAGFGASVKPADGGGFATGLRTRKSRRANTATGAGFSGAGDPATWKSVGPDMMQVEEAGRDRAHTHGGEATAGKGRGGFDDLQTFRFEEIGGLGDSHKRLEDSASARCTGKKGTLKVGPLSSEEVEVGRGTDKGGRVTFAGGQSPRRSGGAPLASEGDASHETREWNVVAVKTLRTERLDI